MPDDCADAIFSSVDLSAIQRREIGGEMDIEEIRAMMGENGNIGGSLDLRGTAITALPEGLKNKVIQ